MQESAYVVIISVLLIDDIQFMIILIPNYETFMANENCYSYSCIGWVVALK